MQLWTDYEGLTIDKAFPLRKLLMPEGRSAFFSTAGTKGEPTVVRLIECHFDEEEILARWSSVEALNHPNFLKFERFGQTELDGRPVVYAVFEKVDGNLAEVLDQGHLDVKDVAELAASLVAALQVLHLHGFIHEHIEPRNIFAIGDVVKLRGDCIREAPEGEEGRAAKQRDVHSLATVLLQGLTRKESIDGIPDYALPKPFGQIIRNGLDGTWGLEKIRAALEAQFGLKPPATPKAASLGPATPVVAEQKPPIAAPKPSMPPEAQISVPPKEDRSAGFARSTARKDIWSEDQSFSLRSRWIGAGILALLLIFSTWVAIHAWNAHRHHTTQAAAVSQSLSQPAAQSANQVSPSSAPTPASADRPRANQTTLAGSHAVWRVIAFTYNRRADAEKKVSHIAQTHPDLKPSVFSPSGHAPYLVSIGGVMDRDAAYALARRSRSLGLPRDMYAQNYSH